MSLPYSPDQAFVWLLQCKVALRTGFLCLQQGWVQSAVSRLWVEERASGTLCSAGVNGWVCSGCKWLLPQSPNERGNALVEFLCLRTCLIGVNALKHIFRKFSHRTRCVDVCVEDHMLMFCSYKQRHHAIPSYTELLNHQILW